MIKDKIFPDGRPRCQWVNPNNPNYIKYHDEEWGRPVHEDKVLFEFLVLEAFQAGLSWECVLGKREAFRKAFSGFDPEAVAHYTENVILSLCEDSRLIRHERKFRAAVRNAQVFCAIQKEFGSFDTYLWGWTQGNILKDNGFTHTPLSDQICKDLKKRGMQFLGSTTVYAYLQAVGVIQGHESNCYLND